LVPIRDQDTLRAVQIEGERSTTGFFALHGSQGKEKPQFGLTMSGLSCRIDPGQAISGFEWRDLLNEYFCVEEALEVKHQQDQDEAAD
jgi:hypothetical protein